MSEQHPNEYYNLLRLAAKYIGSAIKTSLPASVSKDFMLWLLSDNNPHQENYLRMMGVAGSIELELSLFGKVVDETTLKGMANFISLLNAYFAYETLSDNLGVGLALSHKSKNSDYDMQKQILQKFNDVMINKIDGGKGEVYQLLAPIAELIKKISVNQKTLAPQQMEIFIRDYLQQNKSDDAVNLEYSFLEILVLNISTCLQLLESLADNPIYIILKKSLIARYSSVTNIANANGHAEFAALATWGLDSILTVPTLAYCIGALDEVVHLKNFKVVIDNNLLYEAMADGSLLTRLLNDVGTRLLTMNKSERADFFLKLQSQTDKNQHESIFNFLYHLSEKKEFFYTLTRIRKDLKHGEFNVCLDPLPMDKSLNESLKTFCDAVDYYAELYQKTYSDMLIKLKKLAEILNSEEPGKIIHNFVQFHEYKYSLEFESKRGDYAITAEP